MTPSLMTRRELAAHYKVSVQTIDNWCKRGLMTYLALPCGKRFRPEDIKSFEEPRTFHRAEA